MDVGLQSGEEGLQKNSNQDIAISAEGAENNDSSTNLKITLPKEFPEASSPKMTHFTEDDLLPEEVYKKWRTKEATSNYVEVGLRSKEEGLQKNSKQNIEISTEGSENNESPINLKTTLHVPKEFQEATSPKRPHFTEDDLSPEEVCKKRRTEEGEPESSSEGSPHSVREDAENVGSPMPKVSPLTIVVAKASVEEQECGRESKSGGARHQPGEGVSSSPQTEDHEHGKSFLSSHQSCGNDCLSLEFSSVVNGVGDKCRLVSSRPKDPVLKCEEKEVVVTVEEQPATIIPPPPSSPPFKLHPRKRKIRPKDIIAQSANQPPTMQTPSTPSSSANANCLGVNNSLKKYRAYLSVKKQIEGSRKGLFSIQEKPLQGFKDYLMYKCTYVLAGNSANRVPPPSCSAPEYIQPLMRDFFIAQEKERHRLLMQHKVEKEKLFLSVEQEILRACGRAARSLENHPHPFPVRNILRYKKVNSSILSKQEDHDQNSPPPYLGRLVLSCFQDVTDKWEKIKESMLLRHHNEAEGLRAIQKMDWGWKMRELGLCDPKLKPTIDDAHVPMIQVSGDVDL